MSSIIDIVKKHERERGHKENAIATAREMKKDGMPVKQIAKFTKLTLKEIEEL